MAGQEGLEPPTAGFGDRNSGQLSYCPSDGMAKDHNRQGQSVERGGGRGLTRAWPQAQSSTIDASRRKLCPMSQNPAFTFERLHHLQLAIPLGGEDVSRQFWVGILGFVEAAKPPVLAARRGCWFRAGGVEIHLGVEESFTPATRAHPGILVTAIKEFAEHLQSHGVAVTWDPNFPGFERFYAHDPFGNRLEFLQAI